MGQKEPDEFQVLLTTARSLATNLRFPESLQFYRTYLCHCRGEVQVRSEMHQVQQIQIDFEAAKETAQFVGEVCGEFALDSDRLREDLGKLTVLVSTGPAPDAIAAAKQLLTLLETALRPKMDQVDGDVWAQSACWAAEWENYRLAKRLADRSNQAARLQPLYRLLCQAEDWLAYFSDEESSRRDLEKAESLRKAMKNRNEHDINRCIGAFFNNDAEGDEDSPGSGVPTRPSPPNLPANEKRDWPNSPPAAW